MVSSSLRSILAYAGGMLSQLPIPFGGNSGVGTSDNLPQPPLPDLSSPAPSLEGLENPGVVPYMPLSGAPSCPIDGPMSCHNSTPIAGESCCFVYPGGRMLLTQFWDAEVHARGAEEDWTLHGLWPDLCDGRYDAFCNMSPQYNNITAILKHYDQDELVEFMERYWVASYGTNQHLWAHEYNKHATCINTLAPSCYGDAHAAGLEVVDYFTRAAGLFRMLDTYTALARAGIVPSATRHYPLADVVAALERFSGGRVVLRCGGRRRDALHEAWYVYFVRGSLQTGEFVPAQDYGDHLGKGNCAPWVRYLPKKQKKGGKRY